MSRTDRCVNNVVCCVSGSKSRRREGGDGWEASGDGPLCLSDDNDDDEDCATTSPATDTSSRGVSDDHGTSDAWRSQTSQSSTSSVTTSTTASTTTSATTTTTTTTATHPPSLPAGQVVYHVIASSTRSPFLASTVAIDAADVQSLSPVPMNIGLIVGVTVAIAVLLCMLAYVV